jgi:hypothetical protein
MHKAVILKTDFASEAPTAKEIEAYLRKSAKLLYGNDKRKSVNTPYKNNIHLVHHAFNDFKEVITGKKHEFQTSHTLYVFDDQINDSFFFLKYSGMNTCHFKLNDAIISEMSHTSWSHGHLIRYKRELEHAANFNQFMIEKNIVSKKFQKYPPKFSKATDEYIEKIDVEIKALEAKAIALFKSGW